MPGFPLTSYVDRFLEEERPIGTVLSPDIVSAQAVSAANFCATYTKFEELEPGADVDEATSISAGEWEQIKPLFLLYLEREQCKYFESAQLMGVNQTGRSMAEIEADISGAIENIPGKVFFQPVRSVY